VANAPDPQQLLTALTTEHFTLQGARSQTASESASRASLYILSVSSALVALGFIGQASQTGTTFDVFALTVLPTLYVLGVFTFATVVAVINSVVGGSAIAIPLGAIADASLGVAAGVGGIVALASLVALLRYADWLLEERAGRTESIFPSPK
jgi:hypothetical protein